MTAPSVSFADACTAPLAAEMKDFDRLGCELQCAYYYNENPEARPKKGVASTCKTGAVAYAFRTLSPTACLRGAWDGVLSLPETIRAYGMMVEDVGGYIHKNIREHQGFVSRCDRDPSCRRELGRSLAAYSAKDEKGAWLVPDAVVDKEAQSLDIMSLLDLVHVQKGKFRSYCETLLTSINAQVRSEGLASDDFAIARYDRLAAKDPKCIGALAIGARPVPTAENKGGSWLKSLGIKLQCYTPEKITELLCYEVAAMVLDPINLTGGGLALKAAARAGLAAKSSLKVLGRRAGESAVLKLETGEAVLHDFTHSGARQAAHTYAYPVGAGDHQIKVVIPATADGAVDTKMAERMRQTLGAMPDSVLGDLDQLTVNPARNIHDSYWAEQYRMPGLKSAATGGISGGRTSVNFYPAGLSKLIGASGRAQIMAHELGHIVAARRFGTTKPPEGYAFGKQRDGVKVSSYGENSLDEDFAEAMAVYIQTEGGLRQPELLEKFRGRFAFLDDVLGMGPRQRTEIFEEYRQRMESVHRTTFSRVGSSMVLTEAGRITVCEGD